MEFIESVLRLNQDNIMKKETIIKFYSLYKLYIFPGIVTLSCLFLVVFAIYPQMSKFITSQKVEGNLLTKSKFLVDKVQALESYSGEDLSRKVEFALASYPVEKDLGNVIGTLQQLIVKSGFNIVSFSVGNSATEQGSLSFGVKLEVKGSRALFPTLLSNLENSSRLMRVIAIETSSNNTSSVMDVSLSLAVLYSLPPKDFGSIDSPIPKLSQKDEELITRLAGNGTISNISSTTTTSVPRGKVNPFE